MILNLWRDFWRNPWQTRYLLPLIAINFAGSVYGYFWYSPQLAELPFYTWPVVFDSPFSTTLFALALLAGLSRRQSGWFLALAFVCCLKYGFWAVVLINHYWFTGGAVTFLDAMLWLSHWGMVLEGWAYLRTMVLERPAVIVPAAWLAANDFFDYGFGLHPYLFAAGQQPVARAAAVGLTLVILLILIEKKSSS